MTDSKHPDHAAVPPADFHPGIGYGFNFAGNLGGATFAGAVAEARLCHTRRAWFPVGDWSLEQVERLGAEVVMSYQLGRSRTELVLRFGDRTLGHLELTAGQSELAVAGDDLAEVEALCERLADGLRAERMPETFVPVTFWSWGDRQPRSLWRPVAAPPWEALEANYAPGTRAALAELVAARTPGAGRLVLWHGEPGTGKTHALRSLALAWREWCNVHFVLDPEAFFGSHSSYLLDVLFDEGLPQRIGEATGPKTRLLVLEDAGELLAADARAQAGQALSRLLNISDGLIGQGLDALTLITTNEPLGKLHPAIQRPGRCWSQVEFEALPAGQANAWLAERGCGAQVDRATTIAELYALLEGREVEDAPSFGFGREAA